VAQRKAVGFLIREMGLSERRACRIVGLARWVRQYRPVPNDDAAVVKRMKALASENLYRPSEILLMLQGGKRSDEWTVGRQHQAMDGEA